MKIAGKYTFADVYDSIITIPDCFVLTKNKIGTGNGEAKLYFGSNALKKINKTKKANIEQKQ